MIKKLPESYNREVPILNSKFIPIQCSFVEETKDGIILELKQDDAITENEEISYGREIVKWDVVSEKMPDTITQISDGKKNYAVIKQEKSVDSIILHLDTNIPNTTNLIIGKQKVDFNDIANYDFSEFELSDSKGVVGYQIDKTSVHSFRIKSQRKLKGKLVDNDDNTYS
ncbi:MAG: hypothetical protein GQ533_10450, partial [Methanosarcinaceae archaeon]|nr:hypothetical protein [Methanosarcinaceae archaeon]